MSLLDWIKSNPEAVVMYCGLLIGGCILLAFINHPDYPRKKNMDLQTKMSLVVHGLKLSLACLLTALLFGAAMWLVGSSSRFLGIF